MGGWRCADAGVCAQAQLAGHQYKKHLEVFKMHNTHEESRNVLLTVEEEAKREVGKERLPVEKSSTDVPRTTVPLLSKLTDSEKHRATKMAAIAVEIDGEVWFRQVNAMVPETAKIVRDSTGVFVGLPAVVGG
jgi:Fe-S oxidoreductase